MSKARDENYRKPWDQAEDDKLRRLVGEHGVQQWALIASEMPGRNGKQCRERWHNQLDTQLNRDGWTDEEDRILLEGQKRFGNKWAEIAISRLVSNSVGGSSPAWREPSGAD